MSSKIHKIVDFFILKSVVDCQHNFDNMNTNSVVLLVYLTVHSSF